MGRGGETIKRHDEGSFFINNCVSVMFSEFPDFFLFSGGHFWKYKLPGGGGTGDETRAFGNQLLPLDLCLDSNLLISFNEFLKPMAKQDFISTNCVRRFWWFPPHPPKGIKDVCYF